MLGKKIEDFLVNSKRLLKYATKPSSSEIYLLTKVIIITILAIGGISLFIQLIFQTIIGG
ncbi:MAG: preprotein translocase subunit SecE [Candidatus Njordarchaeia archaeon]